MKRLTAMVLACLLCAASAFAAEWPEGLGPAKPLPGVRELELSIRSENCLLRGGIHTIGDLLSRSKDDLLKIRNLGKISLREIEEKLDKLGLHLSDEKASADNTKED